MSRHRVLAGSLPRLVLAASLAAVFATTVGPVAHPSIAAASTADTMENKIVSLVNVERAKRGLAGLRYLTALNDLAGDRAAHMVSINKMEHISCLGCTLTSRGIQWWGAGEVIAWNNYPWGDQAALVIFNGWKNSPGHWSILMSADFNYIGMGVAYRSSNHSTYASAVLTESKDLSKPWAKVLTGTRSGTTVSWTWTGADTPLQTHTSGLRNYDVQYRAGSGSWRLIRGATTATSITLTGRIPGRYYGLRVRARDNAGLVSAYSAEIRVWVP